MIIKHGRHICLRNSQGAQRCVGFSFLIVLFGCWLAGRQIRITWLHTVRWKMKLCEHTQSKTYLYLAFNFFHSFLFIYLLQVWMDRAESYFWGSMPLILLKSVATPTFCRIQNLRVLCMDAWLPMWPPIQNSLCKHLAYSDWVGDLGWHKDYLKLFVNLCRVESPFRTLQWILTSACGWVPNQTRPSPCPSCRPDSRYLWLHQTPVAWRSSPTFRQFRHSLVYVPQKIMKHFLYVHSLAV